MRRLGSRKGVGEVSEGWDGSPSRRGLRECDEPMITDREFRSGRLGNGPYLLQFLTSVAPDHIRPYQLQIDSMYVAEPSRCQASSWAWSLSCWPR